VGLNLDQHHRSNHLQQGIDSKVVGQDQTLMTAITIRSNMFLGVRTTMYIDNSP
jgi:hypothetical protein